MSKRPGLIVEFMYFLRYNKKWWLMPIVVVMMLLVLLAWAGSTSLAPFIYTIW